MEKLMKNLGFYDGRYDLIENMNVPMSDRVCWFGDGVYDATATRNGVIYCLDDHIDRFYNSASMVQIEIPYTKDELKDLLKSLVAKVDTSNTNGETFLYWQITRGANIPRNHIFPENTKANLWVTVTPRKLADVYRRSKLISYEDIRFYMCHIKTLCLLPSVLASEAAKKAGAEECVMYRKEADGNYAIHYYYPIGDNKEIFVELSYYMDKNMDVERIVWQRYLSEITSGGGS